MDFPQALEGKSCSAGKRALRFIDFAFIELNDANRSLTGNHPQDGQGHGMIAADRDRDRTSGMNAYNRGLNEPEAAGGIECIYGCIADVRHVAQSEWSNPAGGMDLSDDPRRFTHGGWPVTRARSKVHTQIEGHADERDVDL